MKGWRIGYRGNPIISWRSAVWCLAISLFLVACDPAIPDNLRDKFESRYPKASDVLWVKDGVFWTVTFYQEKFRYKKVRYTSCGGFLDIEFEIGLDDVPRGLLAQAIHTYAMIDVIRAFKRIGPDSVHYILEGLEEGHMVALVIDENGKGNMLTTDDTRFLDRI